LRDFNSGSVGFAADAPHEPVKADCRPESLDDGGWQIPGRDERGEDQQRAEQIDGQIMPSGGVQLLPLVANKAPMISAPRKPAATIRISARITASHGQHQIVRPRR
jgi:hypothetical protein